MDGAGLMWRWWTCRRLRSRLVDLASGDLPAAERPRVELHVAGCAACRDALAALHQVPALLESSASPGPDEEFWLDQRRSIMRTVRDLPTPARVRHWWRPEPSGRPRRPWVAWAPVLAAATAVLAVVTLHPGQPWRSSDLGTTEVDRLDDPALLSLSDLAGDDAPDPGLGVDVVSSEKPMPELSDDELAALSQLVGGPGR
jgi:Putative zinc-finger